MNNKLFLALFSLLITYSINAQSEDEFFVPKSTLGGYGELHYNYSKADGSNATKILDFHRFVTFYAYSWTEEWSFKAELELEHNFVSEGEGELELEQAYVSYQPSLMFSFQAGVVLAPVGLVNEYHEPPLFFGVERPTYNSNIVPTTWFGNGITFSGLIEDFEYKVAIMEGLNNEKFSPGSGIRGGRVKGFKANAENLLYIGKVDYLGLPGLRAGLSYSYNNAQGDSTENKIALFELHAKYEADNIYGAFEYGNVSFDRGAIQAARGYYIDLGYNVSSLLKWQTKIVSFVRWSDINAGAADNNEILNKQYHTTQWMLGVSVKPIDQVVFKIDYSEITKKSNSQKTKLFNLGVGYMF